MLNKHKIKLWSAILVLPFLISGCSLWVRPEPENALAAAALFSKLKSANPGITNFKGIGRVKIRHMKQLRSVRAAFAGDLEQHRLRIDFMGSLMGAQAVFAGDGRHLYYITRHPDAYHKVRTFDGNLERFIAVPIKINDIVNILAGRIPWEKGVDQARLAKINGDLILSLSRKWSRTSYRVFINPVTEQAEKIEQFDMDGHLVYRAVIVSMQHIDGYDIPGRIRIFNTSGNEIEFKIEKFMANNDISDSVFSPEKPGDKK